MVAGEGRPPQLLGLPAELVQVGVLGRDCLAITISFLRSPGPRLQAEEDDQTQQPIGRWTQSFPRARAPPPRAHASLLPTKRRPGWIATLGSCATGCARSRPPAK